MELDASLKKLKAKALSYWPVSITCMALTYLGSFESLKKFSAYLIYAILIWRDILHGIFELPLNFIITRFGISPFDIPSPIPEIVFLLGMGTFSISRYEHYFWSDSNEDSSSIFDLCMRPIELFAFLFGRFFGNSEMKVIIFLVLGSTVVFFFELFDYPNRSLDLSTVFITFVMLVIGFLYLGRARRINNTRPYSKKLLSWFGEPDLPMVRLLYQILTFFWIVIPRVLFFSFLFVVISELLEFILEPTEEFILKAHEKAGISN